MFFKDLVAKLSEESGLDLEPDIYDTCMLERDGIVISFKYQQESDDIAIFAPVTDPDKIIRLNESALRMALSLCYNGVGTGGGFIGLFEENLVLTRYVPLKDLSVEKFAAILNAFGETAYDVHNAIIAAYQDIPATVSSQGNEKMLEHGLSV